MAYLRKVIRRLFLYSSGRVQTSRIALVLALLSAAGVTLLGQAGQASDERPSSPRDTVHGHHWEYPVGKPPVNSVDIIIADMSEPNDARLLGIPDYNWAVSPLPATLAMATDTRGCKAPDWWLQGTALERYKSCEPWRGFLQWFVIYEGEGNLADNVRVQVRSARSYYLSREHGRWLPLVDDTRSSWFLAAKKDVTWVAGEIDLQNATGPEQNLPEGSDIALRVLRDTPFAYHGVAGGGVADISEKLADIEAIYTTAQARLVTADPQAPDDRDKAVWLFQSGADFYPESTTRAADAQPPGVGVSRSRKITQEWQAFNFATLDVARQDYKGPSRAVSVEALRENPPPL